MIRHFPGRHYDDLFHATDRLGNDKPDTSVLSHAVTEILYSRILGRNSYFNKFHITQEHTNSYYSQHNSSTSFDFPKFRTLRKAKQNSTSRFHGAMHFSMVLEELCTYVEKHVIREISDGNFRSTLADVRDAIATTVIDASAFSERERERILKLRAGGLEPTAIGRHNGIISRVMPVAKRYPGLFKPEAPSMLYMAIFFAGASGLNSRCLEQNSRNLMLCLTWH